MAESSAKSIDGVIDNRREQYGAQVVLLNTAYSSSNNVELIPSGPAKLFDPDAWTNSQPVTTGRGANWFVDNTHQHFVIRHFKRGGAVARILGFKYWFGSEATTRSFAEFHLLRRLHDLKLPVPEPVAAGYCKSGPWYTAQLLTRRIPDSHSWSDVLISSPDSDEHWGDVGRTVARLHKARVDHADLNAHNILVNRSASVFIIDFDKSMERASMEGGWRQANLARLQRSLNKILPGNRASVDKGWSRLMQGYERELARPD